MQALDAGGLEGLLHRGCFAGLHTILGFLTPEHLPGPGSPPPLGGWLGRVGVQFLHIAGRQVPDQGDVAHFRVGFQVGDLAVLLFHANALLLKRILSVSEDVRRLGPHVLGSFGRSDTIGEPAASFMQNCLRFILLDDFLERV